MRLMTIETAIRETDPMRTISGLIFTPCVSSLKNVSRPALEAGIGALSFLLIRLTDIPKPFLRVTPDGAPPPRQDYTLRFFVLASGIGETLSRSTALIRSTKTAGASPTVQVS